MEERERLLAEETAATIAGNTFTIHTALVVSLPL